MENNNAFDIKISKRDLEIIVRTAQSMHDHYDNPYIVDFAVLNNSQSRMAEFIATFKGHETAVIAIGSSDWDTITDLIQHADKTLPGITREDLIRINALSDHYFDLEQEWEGTL